jgi:hypothetical protein
MLKIDKKPKEKMEVYGVEFEISMPTVKQLKHFNDLSKAEGFNEFDGSCKFLVELGVPESVIEDMNSDDFKALIDHVFEPKKK